MGPEHSISSLPLFHSHEPRHFLRHPQHRVDTRPLSSLTQGLVLLCSLTSSTQIRTHQFFQLSHGQFPPLSVNWPSSELCSNHARLWSTMCVPGRTVALDSLPVLWLIHLYPSQGCGHLKCAMTIGGRGQEGWEIAKQTQTRARAGWDYLSHFNGGGCDFEGVLKPWHFCVSTSSNTCFHRNISLSQTQKQWNQNVLKQWAKNSSIYCYRNRAHEDLSLACNVCML